MSNPSERIEAISTDNLEDFLRFFDGQAFSDNPDWSSCYCQCYYENHREIVWQEQTAGRNRFMACQRIGNGTMRGFLAFAGNEAVGWCNAAPRHLLHALDDVPTPDADKLGAIVCFIVAPDHRGKGVARRLLEAACEGLAKEGLEVVEAMPRREARSEAENYVGPLGMYLSAGFTIHREDEDGTIYVRRVLATG